MHCRKYFRSGIPFNQKAQRADEPRTSNPVLCSRQHIWRSIKDDHQSTIYPDSRVHNTVKRRQGTDHAFKNGANQDEGLGVPTKNRLWTQDKNMNKFPTMF